MSDIELELWTRTVKNIERIWLRFHYIDGAGVIVLAVLGFGCFTCMLASTDHDFQLALRFSGVQPGSSARWIDRLRLISQAERIMFTSEKYREAGLGFNLCWGWASRPQDLWSECCGRWVSERGGFYNLDLVPSASGIWRKMTTSIIQQRKSFPTTHLIALHTLFFFLAIYSRTPRCIIRACACMKEKQWTRILGVCSNTMYSFFFFPLKYISIALASASRAWKTTEHALYGLGAPAHTSPWPPVRVARSFVSPSGQKLAPIMICPKQRAKPLPVSGARFYSCFFFLKKTSADEEEQTPN